MLSMLFKNISHTARKLGVGKRTIYNWLSEGNTPNGLNMIRIITIMDADISIYYVESFFYTAKKLQQSKSLEEINAIVKSSIMDESDKQFLRDHFHKRYWKHVDDEE